MRLTSIYVTSSLYNNANVHNVITAVCGTKVFKDIGLNIQLREYPPPPPGGLFGTTLVRACVMSDSVVHSIRTWIRATAGRFTLLLINHNHGSGHHAHILSFNFCMCITSGAVNLTTVSEIILAPFRSIFHRVYRNSAEENCWFACMVGQITSCGTRRRYTHRLDPPG